MPLLRPCGLLLFLFFLSQQREVKAWEEFEVSSVKVPVVQTNPIPGGAGWVGASGTRGDCAKRTQFRPSAREWARAAGAAEGEMCETNPIALERMERASTWQKRSYDELDP
jgi:hypothetical protein